MKYWMKLILTIIVTCSAVASDVKIFSVNNVDGKITPKTIEKEFVKLGFSIVSNREMNSRFIKQFQKTTFDTYNLFTLYKSDLVQELSKNHPNIGLFAPMSMSIYSTKGSNKMNVAYLSRGAISKIVGIPYENKQLIKLENLITKALNKAMPNGTLLSKSYKILATDKPLVTTFKLEMDEEDWDEEKEEFQMSLDGELLPNGFVKAGFTDINIDFDDDYTKFDFYDTESICKLPVIYTIAQTRPEAGAFAPCSLYMYKIKGKNEMQIGFPTVYNWISLLNITRKDDMKLLEDTQTRMIDILTSLTSE